MARSELRPGELYQKSVVWMPTGVNSSGETTVGEPEEIDTRWEEVTRRSNNDGKAARETVTHRVYVDQELPVGTILWKGALEDMPQTPEDLRGVVEYKYDEDLKGIIANQYVLVSKRSKLIKGV